MKKTDKCKGCIYRGEYGICDYILITGKMRNAKYNEDKGRCEKFEGQKRARKPIMKLPPAPENKYEEMQEAAKAQRRSQDTVAISKEATQRKLKEIGMKQVELADRLGISENTVWSVLNRGRCRRTTLERWAAAMNVSPSELTG